jgi:hypothetical protein
MAKPKFDGVVQAVHYNPDGQVAWVRVFLRRGPTFSDRIIMDRNTLIASIQSGKHIVSGQRVLQMASTFDIQGPIQVIDKDGKQILVTNSREVDQDCLEGVPVL